MKPDKRTKVGLSAKGIESVGVDTNA